MIFFRQQTFIYVLKNYYLFTFFSSFLTSFFPFLLSFITFLLSFKIFPSERDPWQFIVIFQLSVHNLFLNDSLKILIVPFILQFYTEKKKLEC